MIAFAVLSGRLFVPAHASPSANRLLNYQLRLTDAAGVPVADGTKNIKISFYDLASGGTRLHTDCGTTGTPVGRKVIFTNGVGTVLIGDTGAGGTTNCTDASAPNAIPATFFNNDLIFLGITIEADAEMTPRKRIVATGYSLNADRLDDLETSVTGGTTAFVPVTDASGLLTLTGDPTTTAAVITANPTAAANELLIDLKNGGASKFSVDGEGDAVIAGTGSLTVNGNTTLGDATSDTITATARFASSLVPSVDDTHDLGTSALRWRDLYLGPTSLHLVSTAGETTTARDWKFGIQETDGATEGNLRILEGSNEFINVTPSGRFGLGIAQPMNPLDIRHSFAAGGGIIRVQNTSASGYNSVDYYDSTGTLRFGTGAGNASVASAPLQNRAYLDTHDTDLVIADDSVITAMFTQGNRVGIGGLTVPGSTLVVQGAGTGTGTSAFNVTDSGAATKLYVRDDGFIGMGTTAPASAPNIFRVQRALTDMYADMNSTSLGVGIFFGSLWNNPGSDPNFSLGTHGFYGTGANMPIDIRTNNIARMSITGGGLVGIGDTTPDALLDVTKTSTSTTAATELAQVLDFTDTGVVTTGTDTTRGLDINLTRTGATGGTINSTALNITAAGDAGGTSTMTGLAVTVSGADSPFAAVFNGGNVGIGTSTPSTKLHLNTAGSGGMTSDATGNSFIVLDSGKGGTAGSQISFIDFQINDVLEGNVAINEGTTNQPFEINSAVTNDISLVTGGGRVGIATTAPESLLNIFAGTAGTITPNAGAQLVIEDNASHYIHMLAPDANETGFLFGTPADASAIGQAIIANSSNGLTFRTGGNTTRMTLDSAGDLGIGTASPSFKLHVDNGTSGGTIAEFQSNTTAAVEMDVRNDSLGVTNPVLNWGIGGSAAGNDVANTGYVTAGVDIPRFLLRADSSSGVMDFATGGFTSSAFVRMRIDSTGNVGIGDTTPDALLDVAGSFQFDGSGTFGDAATDNIIFNADVNSHILPNTDDTFDLGSNTQRWRDLYLGPASLHIGTSTTDEGILTYNTSTNVFSIDSTGTVELGGGSGSTGCSVDASGNFSCTGSVTGSGGGAGGWTDDGAVVRLSATTDLVGIGTTSPESQLEIRKDVSGGLGPVLVIANKAASGAGNAASIRFGVDATSTIDPFAPNAEIKAVSKSATDDTDLAFSLWTGTTFSETVRFLDNGRVGIGDSTPDSFLDVAGSFQFDGNGVFGDASGDTVTSNAASWTFPSDTSVTLTGGVNGINFDTNTFSIDATNNRVGIGTAAPAHQLDVAGTTTVQMRLSTTSTDAAIYFDNTTSTDYTLGIANSGAGAPLGSFYVYDTGAATARLLVASGGNVGIGTGLTAATSKLQIDGGTDASFSGGSGYLLLGAESGLNIVLDNNEINARSAGAESVLHLNADGGEVVIHNNQAGGSQVSFEDNGDLGIGTISPSARLHIESPTNSNAPIEGLTLRRSRADATAPGAADFGSDLTFRLEGFTNDSDAIAAMIRGAWDKAQTNDTTDRDAYAAFSVMENNALGEKMRITASGFVGIGDATPAATLTVGDTDRFQVAGATGDITTVGDLALNGGDLTTTAATFNLVNATAATVNLAGAATTLNIGPGGATATSVNLAGGNAATGCTVAGATGNLTCSGTITAGASITIDGASTPRTVTSDTSLSVLTTGANVLRLDTGGAAAVNIGDVNANAVNLSRTGITTTANGPLTSTGLLTGSAGLTVTGAAVNLNASSNFPVNIATGTSTGAVSIGGNANTVAIDSSDWDITTTGVMTGINSVDNSAGLSIGTGTQTALSMGRAASVTSIFGDRLEIDLNSASRAFNFTTAGAMMTDANQLIIQSSTAGNTAWTVSFYPMGTGLTGDGLTLTAGPGGAGSGATPGGVAGQLSLNGGAGGDGTATAAAGAGAGVTVTGGAGGTNNGGGGANGGPVSIDGGTATGAGTNGSVTIAGTNASSLSLGRSGITTAVNSTAFNFANTVTTSLNNVANAWNIDSNTLSIDALNNRIGIGTASPYANLQVETASNTPFAVRGSATAFDATDANFASAPAALIHSARIVGTGHQVSLVATGDDTGNFGSDILLWTRGTNPTDNPVERMRVDNSGKIGIGTSAPEAMLHAFKASAGSVTAQGNAVIALENNTHAYLNILTPDASESGVLFGNVTNNASGGIIYNNSGNSNGINFRTNGNDDKMFITSGGDVGIGGSPSVADLHVKDRTTNAGILRVGCNCVDLTVTKEIRIGDGTFIGIAESTTDDDDVIFNVENLGISRTPVTYKLEVEGDASKTTAGSWNANSDRRIKTEIQALTGALDKIARLNPVSFKYTEAYRRAHAQYDKEGNDTSVVRPDKRYVNFIAQEFQQVFPEAVTVTHESISGADNILSIDPHNAFVYGLAAIKELNGLALKFDAAGSGTYLADKTGDATLLAQAKPSKSLTFRGSAWDGATGAALDRDLALENVVTGKDNYRLSVKDGTGAEVAYVGSNGDVAIKGRLYPSDRGDLQTSRYIYYDGNMNGPGGDRIRTNAAGWGTGTYDFAEMFPSDDPLIPGELVMVDTRSSTKMRRAVGGREEAPRYLLAGIVSTAPGFLAGMNEAGQYPIALEGRVPTWVVGPVKIGDPITVSLTSGIGIVAEEPTYVVGFALEAKDDQGPAQVAVFVKTGWWNGREVVRADNGTSNAADAQSLTVTENTADFSGRALLNVAAIEGIEGLWSIDGAGKLTANEVVAAKVKAKEFAVAADEEEKAVGRALIETGKVGQIVVNAKVKRNSLIIVTFEKNPSASWWVDEKVDGAFMVKLAQPALENLSFTYWIVAVDGELPDPVPPEPAPEPVSEPSAEAPAEPVPGSPATPQEAAPEEPTAIEPPPSGSGPEPLPAEPAPSAPAE